MNRFKQIIKIAIIMFLLLASYKIAFTPIITMFNVTTDRKIPIYAVKTDEKKSL